MRPGILIASIALAASACSSVTDSQTGNEAAAPVSTTPATTQPPSTSTPRSTTTSTSTSTPTSTSTTIATTLAPDQIAWPTDLADTASQLSEIELAIRAGSDDEHLASLGRRQQQLYQVLSANREWADAAVAATDPEIRQAVELNWQARVDLSALVRSGPLSPTLPAWRVSEPEPAALLLSYYHEAQELTGVDWTYLASINLVETRMGRIEGLSTAGALGPMQFLPSTWESCCEGDPTNVRDAIIGAAVYLTQVGAPSDMNRALFGYNHSDRYVNAVAAYAEVMRADESAYYGYHAWDVYFASSVGILRISPGYEEHSPVAAAEWLADHPGALLDE